VSTKPTVLQLTQAIKEAGWWDTVILGPMVIDGELGVLYTCIARKYENDPNRDAVILNVGRQYGVVGGEYQSDSITLYDDGDIMLGHGGPGHNDIAAEALRRMIMNTQSGDPREQTS
jgi:hypothetical protein